MSGSGAAGLAGDDADGDCGLATLVTRPRRGDRYGVQDTPAGAPVGAPIRMAGDASF